MEMEGHEVLTILRTRDKLEYSQILQWAERLSEFGPYGDVGVGMIKTIKEKLIDAYKKGYAAGINEAEKSFEKRMLSQRQVSGSGV
jgi:hypothetical protein